MKHLQQIVISLILACLIVAPVQAATQMYFVHNDHLGTPQVVTNQSQAVVWQGHQTPFGTVEETTATIEQLARFPGQYFDEESGLSYNYFRDYDPTIGRYVQSDPIGLRGGINTYAYVGGNPLMYTDPTGETPAATFRGGFALGGAFARSPAGQRTIGFLVETAWNITHDDTSDDSRDDTNDDSSECEDDDEPDKGCEALRQSMRSTCASLTGTARMKCFFAAEDAYNQCLNER